MNKSRKDRFNHFMNRNFGDPRFKSNVQRVYIIRMMGRWLRQKVSKDGGIEIDYSVRHGIDNDKLFPKPAKSYDVLDNCQWIDRHSGHALVSFKQNKNHRIGYWGIHPVTANPPFTNMHDKKRWEKIRFVTHKGVEITISPAYHITVALHGVRRDDRKIVQKIFEPRDYGDKKIWKCFYWNLGKLGNNNESWKDCTHHEGFVVKHFDHVVVEESLHKAVQVAERRVAADLVKQIQTEVPE